MITIKPNYSIPEGFERLFMFEEAETGFRHVIVVDHDGIHIGEMGGRATDIATSRCLDWIHETLEEVRQEVCDVR